MLLSVVKPLGRFAQQPWEKRRYKVNYTKALGDTELGVTPSFVIDVTTDPVLLIENAAMDPTGKFLVFYVSGGVDGTTYKISIRLVTSAGQRFEDEAELTVEER